MSERNDATKRVREAAAPLAVPADGTVTVGVRELRDHLSQYLDLVKDGRAVSITEHGAMIGTIVPMRLSARTMELYAQGRVRLPKRPRTPAAELPRIAYDGDFESLLRWAKADYWDKKAEAEAEAAAARGGEVGDEE